MRRRPIPIYRGPRPKPKKKRVRPKVGAAIRAARRAIGMTQAQLGQRAGVKGQAVYRWERDDAVPSRRTQRELVAVVRAVHAAAATRLAIALGLEQAPPPPAPPAEPVLTGSAAFETGMYMLADVLDVPIARLRSGFARFLSFAGARHVQLGQLPAMLEHWQERHALQEAQAAAFEARRAQEALEHLSNAASAP